VRTYERDGCLSPIRLMSAERAQQRTCGILKHEEKDHPKSILARGQFITDAFDDSSEHDLQGQPDRPEDRVRPVAPGGVRLPRRPP
jgi:hypothetical protein